MKINYDSSLSVDIGEISLVVLLCTLSDVLMSLQLMKIPNWGTVL